MGAGNEKIIRVIQQKGTGLYLTDSGQWTSDLEKAQNLPSVIAAVRLSRALSLQGVELVLKFGDGNYDLRLEL